PGPQSAPAFFSTCAAQSRTLHSFPTRRSSDLELPSLVGQAVRTRGWVMTTRSSGKIGFVMLRDGTGYLQVVLSKKDVPEAAWEADRKSTRLNSSHEWISYAVFCLKKKRLKEDP